jgi:hypothetical protein
MAAPDQYTPSPKSVVRMIRSGQLADGDAPEWVIRAVAQNSAEAAAGGIAEEGAADAAIGAAVLGGITAGTVILCGTIVLLVLLIIFVFMNLFKGQLREIPLGIGDKLADSVDWVDHFLEGPAIAVENACYAAWNDMVKHARAFILGVLGVTTLPGPREIIAVTTSITAPLATTINRIDKTTTTIEHIVSESAAHIGAQTHALWSRITSLEDWIQTQSKRLEDLISTVGWIATNVHQLWDWVHQILNYIHNIWAQIESLATSLHALQVEVKTLEDEIDILKGRLQKAEDILVPVAEISAVITLLAPLIESGPEAINVLERLSRDPCMCFKIPGSDAWWLTVMVGDLIAKDGF